MAHSKEQSRDYIPYYKRDQDYIETYKNILLTSRLIVHYGACFLRNLPTDYDIAKIAIRFQNTDRVSRFYDNSAKLSLYSHQLLELLKSLLKELPVDDSIYKKLNKKTVI